MKTILIIAYECFPYHRPGSTMGSLRPYHFAKYLPDQGWRTIVICCDFNRRRSINKTQLEEISKEVDSNLNSYEDNNFQMIPLPSLEHADIIDRIWWKLTGTDKRTGVHYNKQNWIFSSFRKIFTIIKLFRGDHSQNWQSCVLSAMDELQKHVKIDVCLATHGPDAGIFLAHRFYTKYNIPWIVDFRDPVLLPIPRIIIPVYRSWLKRKLKTSEFCVNVSPYWSKLDNKFLGRYLRILYYKTD